ncbi:MAG: type II toxin-antitoxin system RelE/ParE family toxin [Thiohalomonadales bacterium]
MILEWHKEAVRDLDRLFYFLYEDSPLAAIQAIDTIEQGSDILLDHPNSGINMQDGTHRQELFIPFNKGSYILRYRVDNEKNIIVILRVWHSKEDRPHY